MSKIRCPKSKIQRSKSAKEVKTAKSVAKSQHRSMGWFWCQSTTIFFFSKSKQQKAVLEKDKEIGRVFMSWSGQTSSCHIVPFSSRNVVNDARDGGCAPERGIFMPHHMVVRSASVSRNCQDLEAGNLVLVAAAVKLLAAAHFVVHLSWPLWVCCGDVWL